MLGNILQMELNPVTAARVVADIANERSRVFFTQHAEERMAQRGITRVQVLRCLRYGRVIEGPYRDTHGCWKLTIRGVSAGEVISVVLVFDWQAARGNYAVIITSWS